MSSGRSGSCLQYAISTLRHTVSDITVLLSDTLLRWALLFLARGLRRTLSVESNLAAIPAPRHELRPSVARFIWPRAEIAARRLCFDLTAQLNRDLL